MKLRKFLLTLLLSIMTIFAIDTTSILASTASTLVIHYHRYDDDYTDWSLWLWPNEGEGTDYQFTSTDDFGAVATIDLSNTNLDGSNSVGILIKDSTGSSWIKDFDADRFIDMTSSNTVHAYFLQGEEFFSYVSEDQETCDPTDPNPFLCSINLSGAIIDAFVTEDLKIKYYSSEEVTHTDIKVYENSVEVPFTSSISGTNGELTLSNSFNMEATYALEITANSETDSKVLNRKFDYDSTAFESNFGFDGTLGHEYTDTETTFNLWAPLSSEVELNLYNVGHRTSQRSDGENAPYEEHVMSHIGKGVWQVTLPGDMHGKYYTFDITNNGSETTDIQDPYGVSFGLNGQRSMVLDLESTDPIGWNTDSGVDGYTNPNEAIIYEIHVRDLTSSSSWGGPSEYSGKYMGFTVEGTTYTNESTGVTVSTGLDHLIELGITHVHLLPTYDQDGWNDEANFSFNWGYNPQHFNSPEGGYSTDPYDGTVRVNEYKQMVMTLHENGINVINDVVYNHVANGGGYSMNQILPYYFSRVNNGNWSNGSGVGNETATERYMVNKFIVDSVKYWAEEFHIDGFRFDLMAVHDYENMNNVANAVEAIDPDIFVYGEPWGGGTIDLPGDQQAGKQNLYRMPLIAAFNDEFRNALKGSPDGTDQGYVSNGYGIDKIMNGIKGNVIGTTSSQSINYVSAHDNLTLYDKLLKSNGYNQYLYYEDMDYQQRLASSVVLLSQGIPFLHGGSDFLRTKYGNHNSYEAPDSVNQFSYVKKANYVDTFEYFKGIIEIRKEFDSFKMTDRNDINNHLSFLYPEGYGMIGYRLTKNNEDILVYHNPGVQQNDVSLPSGAWKLIADRDQAGLESLGTFETRYPIEESETLIFVKGNSEDVTTSPLHEPVITSSVGIIYETGAFNLKSNTLIHSYSINGGPFITLETPTNTTIITNLEPGEYEFIIRDEYGTESNPYILKVLEVIPLTCPDGQYEKNGECVDDEEPLVCGDNQKEVNGECVDIQQSIICEDGETVVDGKCVPMDTGCFGAITSKNPLSIIVLSVLAVLSILVFRKVK